MRTLKQNLSTKLKKKSGFTLVEMLIVVAIIAILIAISIPIVNAALERAREATDAANERAAMGAAMIEYLEADTGATTVIGATGGSAAYKIENGAGSLVATGDVSASSEFQYGKGTTAGDVNADNAGKYIEVTVTADGVPSIEWKKAS